MMRKFSGGLECFLMIFWGQAMLCFQLRDYFEYFCDLIHHLEAKGRERENDPIMMRTSTLLEVSEFE